MARKSLMWILLVGLVGASILAASCGGEGSTGDSQDDSENGQSSAMSETTMTKMEDTAEETTPAGKTESGEAAELARAEIGPKEITNMLPADGKKPDAPQPLPENPPKGIEVYPATTNRTVDGPIEYDRNPPTNGNHAPLWQNCGFYQKPIQDRHAVHSMDHGVVWITHSPDLPQQQIESLRPYGNEELRHSQPVSGPGRARNRHLMEGPARTERRKRPTPRTVRRRVQGLRTGPPLRQPLHPWRRQPGRVKSSGLAGRRRKPYPDTCNVTSRVVVGRFANRPYTVPL